MSLVAIQRRIKRIEEKVKPSDEPEVTVYMWTPDGKDKEGGTIQIKSLTAKEIERIKKKRHSDQSCAI